MPFLRSALVAAITRVSISMDCRPPTRSMRLLLQKAKQFNLQRQRDFTDFIQKKRSATGAFQFAFALGVRAGERAFFMAEQFAFQQGFRNGAAIDGHERAVLSLLRW